MSTRNTNLQISDQQRQQQKALTENININIKMLFRVLQRIRNT